MKALITGITGFAGSHLAELLLSEGLEVHGTKRVRSPLDNLEAIRGQVQLLDCELIDTGAVRRLLERVQPQLIFHLAAQSYVLTSWSYPAYTLFNNLGAELSILEAVRSLELDASIHIAGSSEEYGKVEEDELPLTEESPLRPLSPYGVSKVAQDLLGYQYFQSYGLRVVRTRAFNHTGPRRGSVFATSNFALQIAEIEAGKREPVIKVGNLSAKRDFCDVRDVVRAYYLVATRGTPGEVYNVCSGRTITIEEMLKMLLAEARVEVRTEVDPARLRPSDVMVLQGDASKIKRELGWESAIALQQSLKDLLEYWRERVGNR
ncbi:MAG: GDP-mannose 4,6-dehydratase [Planctomycetales bacterium 4484_113]|nr:MAG: GDP-mannose 4,6-dehydratase [Planctomycetales bacterium 4484_113]